MRSVQGPAVPDRRRGPSHRSAGAGRTRPRPQDGAGVLRRAREERCKQIELVSADMAAWISRPITNAFPTPSDASTVPRRDARHRGARRRSSRGLERGAARATSSSPASSKAPVRSWKNPENLTDRQAVKLAVIQQTNARLYRAYLLKEHCARSTSSRRRGESLLDGWLKWARRSRLPAFGELARDHRTTRRHPRRDPVTGSPTPGSNRSTPRSGSSPAARSGSTAPKR